MEDGCAAGWEGAGLGSLTAGWERGGLLGGRGLCCWVDDCCAPGRSARRELDTDTVAMLGTTEVDEMDVDTVALVGERKVDDGLEGAGLLSDREGRRGLCCWAGETWTTAWEWQDC